jgi:cytoskeletal protein CcmA (bactofilin family)
MALSGELDPAQAKSPGETHCYKKVCHRVKTIAETRRLVGETTSILTTYYDHPSVDRYNVGKYTSSGEVFNAGDPTRASSSNLPDGTELLVRNPENERTIHVRINDFGPFHTQRKLDLTRAAAQALGFLEQGVISLNVTVVAPPPDGAPRYKRNRRYPPALGYVGTLDELEVGRLARLLIHDRAARWLTNAEILEFVRSERPLHDSDLLPIGRALYVKVDFPTIRATGSTTTYAAETEPRPLTNKRARLTSAATRSSGPPVPQRNFARLGWRRLEFATTDTLAWLGRREGSRIAERPTARWDSPPVVMASASARIVDHGRLPQLPGAQYAMPARSAPPPVEVAAFDSKSIRMIVPGLHVFMGLMAPHWGRQVTPPQALGAVTTVAFMLLIMTWVTLEFSSLQPVHARPLRRAPAFPNPLRSSVPARATLPGVSPSDTAAPVLPQRDKLEPPAMIPKGVRVEGVVVATRPLLIAGQLKGECYCERLVVGAQGSVEGSVRASELAIYGQVTGTINTGRLRVENGANVEGEIFQKTLDVKPHAQVHATIHRLPEAAE